MMYGYALQLRTVNLVARGLHAQKSKRSLDIPAVCTEVNALESLVSMHAQLRADATSRSAVGQLGQTCWHTAICSLPTLMMTLCCGNGQWQLIGSIACPCGNFFVQGAQAQNA